MVGTTLHVKDQTLFQSPAVADKPWCAWFDWSLPRWLLGASLMGGICFAGVVFYVQLGQTTLRFQIDDPSLAVRFGDQEITIDNDGQEIRIAPATRHQFTVLQNGAEVVGTSFELKRKDKAVLRVSTAKDGGVQILSDARFLPAVGTRRCGRGTPIRAARNGERKRRRMPVVSRQPCTPATASGSLP